MRVFPEKFWEPPPTAKIFQDKISRSGFKARKSLLVKITHPEQSQVLGLPPIFLEPGKIFFVKNPCGNFCKFV